MTEKEINSYTENYCEELNKRCCFWERKGDKKNRKTRLDKFNEILLEINSNGDPEMRPYLRVALGYKLISENMSKSRSVGVSRSEFTMDHKEIAYYITTVFEDIEYVAANDKNEYRKAHNNFFIDDDPCIISLIIHAIAEHCPKEIMQRYMNCAAHSHYCKVSKKSNLAFFSYVVHEYALREDYQSMAEYGKLMTETLGKNGIYNSYLEKSSYFIDDLESTHTELDKAFKKLGIKDANHDIVMKKVITEKMEKARKEAAKEADKRHKESLFKNIEDISSENMRILKFKSSVKEINKTYPELKREYMVKLCYAHAEAYFKVNKSYNAKPYKELAFYLSEAMDSIEYVAANDTSYYADYQNIYRIDNQDFTLYIAEAIIRHISDEGMKRFMNSVVTINYNKDHLENLVRYFRSVIQIYTKNKNYKEAANYIKWFKQVYEERVHNCTCLSVDRFIDNVDAIYMDIDTVYKALRIKDKEHEEIMVGVRKRAAETWKEKQDRKKAELYDLALRCQASGDEAGYCGYMSALGDIGR